MLFLRSPGSSTGVHGSCAPVWVSQPTAELRCEDHELDVQPGAQLLGVPVFELGEGWNAAHAAKVVADPACPADIPRVLR